MLYNLFTQVLSVEVLSGILKFGCSSIFGLSIYISHSIFLNRYLSNQNNLLTAIILPPIIYIITLAISTDLFLSLGMIGALSIVRYRTPVKSQYDLVLLLSLISIGITMGVNIKFGILTVLFLIFVAPSGIVIDLKPLLLRLAFIFLSIPGSSRLAWSITS